jgi:membrane protease subunit HflC
MNKSILFIVVSIAATIILFSSIYVVDEGKQAIVTQFGAPVGEARHAGLNFKLPLVQKVMYFEQRIMKWDGDPNQIPTKDKKFIWVDTTARWKIVDPLLFFKTVKNERGAQSRLDDIIDSVVRDAVSGRLLVELVRGDDYKPPVGDVNDPVRFEVEGVVVDPTQLVGRETILADMLNKAQASTPEYGIELLDVQIKRINYVETVRTRVYERMINERKKVAAQYRSEGEGEQADILGQMAWELKKISSEAQRRATEIRGGADAKASAIYAKAYNKDKDFYAFQRTLESYKKSINDNSKLVITTDSDFYKYMKKAR